MTEIIRKHTWDGVKTEKPKKAKAHRNYRYWTTAKELEFISGLGSHNKKHPRSQKRLLGKYLAAMPLRVDWNGMNPDEIRKHASILKASY